MVRKLLRFKEGDTIPEGAVFMHKETETKKGPLKKIFRPSGGFFGGYTEFWGHDLIETTVYIYEVKYEVSE